MNFNSLNELQTGNLSLRKIDLQDKVFINDVFKDREVHEFYVMPEEFNGQVSKLLDCWLNDFASGAGFSWIILEKQNEMLSSTLDKCGFIAVEFSDSFKRARLSYALVESKRKKGIMTKSIGLVIDNLKKLGVEIAEADIDKENISSEKIIVKLGFTTDKSKALMDTKIASQGIFRIRHLWSKRLRELSSGAMNVVSFGINATIEELVSAINRTVEQIKSNGENPDLVGRYFYLLGRIKFLQGAFKESRDAFGESNSIKRNHEAFYWFARINQAEGKSKEDIMWFYDIALKSYQDNPALISKDEILKAIAKL